MESDGVFRFAAEFGSARGLEKDSGLFRHVAAQPFARESDGGSWAILRDTGSQQGENGILGLRFDSSGHSGALLLKTRSVNVAWNQQQKGC